MDMPYSSWRVYPKRRSISRLARTIAPVLSMASIPDGESSTARRKGSGLVGSLMGTGASGRSDDFGTIGVRRSSSNTNEEGAASHGARLGDRTQRGSLVMPHPLPPLRPVVAVGIGI